ncbi:MAG: hypothetical protein DWQ05_16910 [Calditrichaeota bacterium]|nr:MAG: hypothetical protein DWQ05_16910 [Calditrichota bacterium]
MKVFKYLVALADISVGFLGLFFIIFAVTRPVTPEVMQQNRALDKKVRELQNHLQSLQNIELSRTGSGTILQRKNAAEIIILTNGNINVKVGSRKQNLDNAAQFATFAQKQKWPQHAILYIERTVPFAQVTEVIDHLRQKDQKIQVQIATLRKK